MDGPLFDLAYKCTVRLSVPGGHGTGFFVAPGLILTCAHVVEVVRGDITRIKVLYDKEEIAVESIKIREKPYPDLALIKIDLRNHPCVYIDNRIQVGDKLYAYGFTSDYLGGESSSVEYESPARINDQQWLLKFKGGQIIPGYSGGPLLNMRTWGICGIVKSSRDKYTDLGGGGIPSEVVLKEYPELIEHQQIYHKSNQRWQNARNQQTDILPQDDTRNIPYDSGELPEDFIPRPYEYEKIKQALLARRRQDVAIIAALKGAGGYGKTVLANALCRDEDIKQAYFDGIIRIVIGKEKTRHEDLIALIVYIIEKLTGKQLGFHDLNVASEQLASVIDKKHVLLVIDDVWQEQQLRPFLRNGNDHCARLITTRNDDALPKHVLRFPVDQLTPKQSLNLISCNLPEIEVIESLQSLKKLVKKLGYWAQVLAIANRWIWDRTQEEYTVSQAVEQFSKRLKEKNYTSFDPENETERDRAIKLCIEASIEDLALDKLQRFQELGIFPEDEEIPLEMVQALWRETGRWKDGDSEHFCQKLYKMSLLQGFSGKKQVIKLHDNMLFYLRAKLGSYVITNLQNVFLAALSKQFKRNWANIPVEKRYLWKRLTWHLREADRQLEAENLLTDYLWVKRKLMSTNAQSLYAEYQIELETQGAKLIGMALALSIGFLSKNPSELSHQLWGRLSNDNVSGAIAEIKAFIEMAQQDQKSCCLQLIKPTLTHPGAEQLRLTSHLGVVYAVAFSPDGTLIVTASEDKTARVWDSESGDELLCLIGHENAVYSAMFSPDGTRIVTASEDKTARIWDSESGNEFLRLIGHENGLRSAMFSPLGTRIVTASWDKTARVWFSDNGNELFCLKGHEDAVFSAMFSPDDSRIVTASWDKTLRVWNAESGNDLLCLKGHEDAVYSAMFSSDGMRIVTASRDKTVRVWSTETGSELCRLIGHENFVRSAMFNIDSTRIVTSSSDKTVRVWNAEHVRELDFLNKHEDQVESAMFSPDGTLIVTASRDRTARVWDSKISDELLCLVGHQNLVRNAMFSPDGTRIITASWDKTVRVWNVEYGSELHCLTGHEDFVNSAMFSPDGSVIVTASTDCTVRIWSATRYRELLCLNGHLDLVCSAIFSPDGKHIVSASRDKTVRVWDTESGNELLCLTGHKHFVYSAMFSLDGKRIISTSWDKTVRVWDTESGNELLCLKGHEDPVFSAMFSSDGKRIVSVSSDRTVRVWDVDAGRQLSCLSFDASLYALAIHGSKVILGDRLGRLHLLEMGI